MIAAVTGEVLVRRPYHVVIDASGVGYRLAVSAETLKAVPARGKQATLHSHLVVRDDSISLYGFASEEERGQRGSETILVMEDQEMVRKFSQTVLSRHGYEVLAPANVEEALELARSHRGPIHLLLTDVIMPGMNGSALWERLRGDRPQLKVLFMSGYTDDVIAPHGVEETQGPFLQKPFSVKSLTEKVRMALDAGPSIIRDTTCGFII